MTRPPCPPRPLSGPTRTPVQIRIADLTVTKIPHGGERRLRTAIEAQVKAMLARERLELPARAASPPETCVASPAVLRHTDALAAHLAHHLHPAVAAHTTVNAR